MVVFFGINVIFVDIYLNNINVDIMFFVEFKKIIVVFFFE